MSANDDHQRIIMLLNSSGLQRTNPALYDAIKQISLTMTQIDRVPLIDFGVNNIKSTDANGTRIDFNVKTFNHAYVVATGVLGTSVFVCIKGITKTYFTALAFTDAGARVSCPINWFAYGN